METLWAAALDGRTWRSEERCVNAHGRDFGLPGMAFELALLESFGPRGVGLPNMSDACYDSGAPVFFLILPLTLGT